MRTVVSLTPARLWNCLLFPFVLVWKSIYIYVFPCIGVYVIRFLGSFSFIFCCICKAAGCYYYKDEEFTGAKALGDTEDLKAVDAAAKTDWVRANELSAVKKAKAKRMNLFDGKIEPADLCQGSVGDCWLVAALAGLAESPGAIQNCFLNREYSERGKYQIRLYSGREKKWETVTVVRW